MNAKLRHLREKNLRLEIVLEKIVERYGDRPHHDAGLCTSEDQTCPLIKRAMEVMGSENFHVESEVKK